MSCSFKAVFCSFLLASIFVLVTPLVAIAEGSAEIVKLCDAEGNLVRYASSNLNIPGLSRCGELRAQKTCGAAGERFFSASNDNAPYGFLDCGLGQRIYVERHGPPIEVAEEPKPDFMAAQAKDAPSSNLDAMLQYYMSNPDAANGANRRPGETLSLGGTSLSDLMSNPQIMRALQGSGYGNLARSMMPMLKDFDVKNLNDLEKMGVNIDSFQNQVAPGAAQQIFKGLDQGTQGMIQKFMNFNPRNFK